MRQVIIKLLKDGSGRVCIHWFIRDERGPAVTPEGTIKSSLGMVRFGGTKGRIACAPGQKAVTPQTTRQGIEIGFGIHSDEPRAVTCPACRETPEFKKAMEEIEETLQQAPK